MRILITYATRHGSTRGIAERIAAVLAGSDLDVTLRDVHDVRDLDSLQRYDAFVIGSAIYLGRWLKPATTFIEAHHDELRGRPTWLFSSGPIVGEPVAADPSDAAKGEAAAKTLHAREHRLFGGKLDKSKLNWCEKIAVRGAHASEGDHRDWAAIDEWTASIAQELRRNPADSASNWSARQASRAEEGGSNAA